MKSRPEFPILLRQFDARVPSSVDCRHAVGANVSTAAASEPQFPFHHGRIALSFVGTVGDRGSLATERVGTPRALAAWLLAAGLVAERVTPSPAQVRRALALREAIARAVRALVDGGDPRELDVELINGAARRTDGIIVPRREVNMSPRCLWYSDRNMDAAHDWTDERPNGSALPLRVVLIAAAVNAVAIAAVLIRFPVIFGAERRLWVLLDVAVPFVYGAVAIAVARNAEPSRARALRQATWLGLIAGVVQGADIAREYLLNVGPGPSFAIGLAGFAVTAACFAIAGARAGTGVGRGALAGAWAAMTAMLTLWIFAWLWNLAFTARLEQILIHDPDYGRGNTLFEMPAYTFWNTLSAAASHAPILPIVGAALGTAGAWCALTTRRVRSGTA